MIIWFYHRVLPSKQTLSVDLKTFERQIRFLKESGFLFIDSNELIRYLSGDASIPEKSVMITFDDGWADNFIFAQTVLAKFAVKATLAVSTGLINPAKGLIRTAEDYPISDSKEALSNAVKNKDFSSFLTWDELREMKKSGLWDIQAHANSHLGCYRNFDKIRGFFPKKDHWTMEFALGEKPFLGAPRATFESIISYPKTTLSENFKEALRNAKNDSERLTICKTHPCPIIEIETAKEFENRVANDLNKCREKMQEKLDIEPISLFWPWGQSSKKSIEIALKQGFKLLFNAEKNAVTRNTDKTAIPRVNAPEKFHAFKIQHYLFSTSTGRSTRHYFYALFSKRANDVHNFS